MVAEVLEMVIPTIVTPVIQEATHIIIPPTLTVIIATTAIAIHQIPEIPGAIIPDVPVAMAHLAAEASVAVQEVAAEVAEVVGNHINIEFT